MVLASRQLKPANRAASVQPPNLPVKAKLNIATVKPQVMPSQIGISKSVI